MAYPVQWEVCLNLESVSFKARAWERWASRSTGGCTQALLRAAFPYNLVFQNQDLSLLKLGEESKKETKQLFS